jgi:hypothetical protein
MARKAIVFEAPRRGYGIDQVADSLMTVAELMEILQEYDEDTLVVISHDNGYTYGSLSLEDERVETEEGEWE